MRDTSGGARGGVLVRTSGAVFGVAAACLVLVIGCDSNDSAGGTGDGTTGASGAATTSTAGSGGSGSGGVPAAEDFITAEAYDCRAAGDDVPVGARPHAAGCLYDPDCRSRFIMGHRMGNPFGPENTLSVLRASIQLGVDVAETDIRITADDRVVLLHDAEVARTLEGTGDAHDLTLAEIQAMKVVVSDSDPAGDFSCEHAPSLEEAMEVARGKIVVELETKNIEAAPIAAAYLRDNDLYDSAYIQCDAEECVAAREGADDVPIAFRMMSLDELPILEAMDPPPFLVEVDNSDDYAKSEELLAVLDARGIKLFTDVFVTADLLAGAGDYSQYDATFERGFDMLQSEVVHLALFSQGRIEPR